MRNPPASARLDQAEPQLGNAAEMERHAAAEAELLAGDAEQSWLAVLLILGCCFTALLMIGFSIWAMYG